MTVRLAQRGLCASLLALAALAWGAPARAQLGGGVSVQNDYEFRGISLSARRPVAIADLSYDASTGIYVNATVVGAVSGWESGLVGWVGNIGYARRLAPWISLDGGISHSAYSYTPTLRGDGRYDEVYAGIIGRNLSTHAYFSPDHYYRDVYTGYFEVEGFVEPVAKVHLNAHVGYLDYISQPYGTPKFSNQYDWRLGVSRPIGRLDLRASVSGGGPGADYFGDRLHNRTALVIGARWTL